MYNWKYVLKAQPTRIGATFLAITNAMTLAGVLDWSQDLQNAAQSALIALLALMWAADSSTPEEEA